jgi:HEAT repeat protein
MRSRTGKRGSKTLPRQALSKALSHGWTMRTEMKPQTLKAVEELRTGDTVALWEAVKYLIQEDDLEIIPHLLTILADGVDAERRVAAVSALGSMRAADALAALVHILDDRNEPSALRDEAAVSLGYLGDPRARDALIRGLDDRNADVVFSCVFALRFVGTQADASRLETLATDSALINSYGRPVAREAQEAVEEIARRARE